MSEIHKADDGSFSLVNAHGGVLVLCRAFGGWVVGVQPNEGNEMLMTLNDDDLFMLAEAWPRTEDPK